MARVKMVCVSCGSEDILKDAYAEWDTETQMWVLSTAYDETRCMDCDAVHNYCDQVEIND